MKILHTYCLNHNLGDYMLGIGVKNLLRRYLDPQLIAETNLQGTVFNEYYIENVVNKKYDLLVIGGGGVIHGAHWPNGWFWLIDEKNISKIKIPFIVYGVGYNYFSDEEGIPPVGRSHLAQTIKSAAHFSVRNDGSAERVADQLGVVVPEIPDPGFHIGMDRTFTIPNTERFVIIQVANDKPEHRFLSLAARDSFVNEFRKVVIKLAGRYKVIFAPHVLEDIELSHKLSDGIANAEVWPFSSYAFDRTFDCVGHYQNAEFVIAMRGHGQIIPLSLGTPVISVENHPKHGGLMRKLGLEDYNVLASERELAKELLAKVNLIETRALEYRSRLKNLNEEMLKKSEAAWQDIKGRISSS